MLQKSMRNVALVVVATGTLAFGLTPSAPVAGQDEADTQATIEMVSVSKLNVPEAHPVRTTARLMVPPRAQWQTVMADESLILSLETGSLRVGLHDGQARIVRAIDSIHWIGASTLDEIGPGEEATMWAGDRLVIHDNGTLVVHGVGDVTAIAALVHVTTRH